MPQHEPSLTELFRRLWPIIQPFRWKLLWVWAMAMLSIPLTMLTPLPLTIAVDSIVGSRPLPAFLEGAGVGTGSDPATLLPLVLAAFVLIALATHLQGLALWRLSSHTGERLILSFRARLFEHLQHLCVSYHDQHGPMDSVYRLQHDAASVKQIPIDAVIPLTRAVTMLLALAVPMLVIDWQFALVALGMLPILFLLTRRCGRRLRATWSVVKVTESATIACAQEVLAATRVVQAFGREEHEHRRFLAHATEWVHTHNSLASVASGFDFLFGMAVATGTAIALGVGLAHVKSGLVSMGDFLLLMAYMAQLAGPLDMATKKMAELQSCLVGFRRALSILEIPPKIVDHPGARPLRRARGSVAFKNVSFAYPGCPPILRRVSFAIPPGSTVGIIGSSGAGKSTLINILTRFLDPTDGSVLLDGVDLRDYRLADLRRQFAIVPQDPVLFATTIAANIRYGNPDATDEEVERAARAAHAHQFIVQRAQGYEHPLGERGAGLSGGERQRVALARAFLRDAPIVILDEPTSALDPRTEAELMEVLGDLARGRTTFLITHRPSTLKHCDIQLILKDGRVTLHGLDLDHLSASDRPAPVTV